MTLPRLERALVAIAAQLTEITTANGFNTEAGAKVFRQRKTFVESELPCISVNYLSETPRGDTGGSNVLEIDVSIGIDIHVRADDDDAGTQMQLGRADIMRSLGAWTYSRGVRDDDDEICGLNFAGADAIPREDGGISEGIRINVLLVHIEGRGDPTKKSKFSPT